jgi:hypothetical protein
MRTQIVVTATFLIAALAAAQTQPPLHLMPMPASVRQASGQLAITQLFSVAVSGAHDSSLDE